MDIAAFISELLEHQSELVVPGLGSFYRSRIEGYYSKEQQQFYPPSLQLQFTIENLKDDGKLVAQIAQERNVNTASATYFLEKYINNLLHQVETESVAIGDLGTFTMRRNQLIFTPRKLNNNNELFYGLAPVRLKRHQYAADNKSRIQVPVTEKPSAFTAALLRGEPMPGKLLTTSAEEEAEEEVTEKKPRISTWILILALVILLTGIGLIIAYRMNPLVFDRFLGRSEPPPVSQKSTQRAVSDSAQQAIQTQKDIGTTPDIDSVTQSKILPPETPRDTFGIVLGSFTTAGGAKKNLTGGRAKAKW